MRIDEVFDVNSDLEIRSIMFDSRKRCEDSIFFAMKGKINDGHRFIETAIENGAVCIVYSDPIERKHDDVLYIQADDPTKAYVTFCNAYYGHPMDKLNVIGITGTNGKTTIAWIIRSILSHFDKCGYIGTMGYSTDGTIKDSKMFLTTPKSDELFRIGREMLDEGCKALVLEASSEGLVTHRLDQVCFSTAVFNNLSGEHFDVHGTMEEYFKAKCILFEMLKEDGKAIINIDDDYGKRLMDLCDAQKITYGIDEKADYQAANIKLYSDHSSFDLLYKGKVYPITTNMPARFNIYNLLAVIAVLNENGYPIEDFLPYLENVELTPGRCQLIDEGQDFSVVVDFAFTPNSFDKVFDFADSITKKGSKIIVVFGAAGDRDHKRRPGTVKVADERADAVILSYDDPSTEDMLGILKEMETYFKRLKPEIILDRIEAINKAVEMAESGDTILLLGKGSDHFFLCKEGRVPYISDETVARNAILKKLHKN